MPTCMMCGLKWSADERERCPECNLTPEEGEAKFMEALIDRGIDKGESFKVIDGVWYEIIGKATKPAEVPAPSAPRRGRTPRVSTRRRR